ncbi:hypothetical protein N7449_005330 [Penicillium cf. viridicatum]|uniref:Uncharacterized protein n=1 Tax=Penicillium cf. viridicatum TaxID=2972119 RepID=A0A9W9MKW0_9EURO|nr:hypothetical protein N7449_005330 [Penicillium cf. viridicatum]
MEHEISELRRRLAEAEQREIETQRQLKFLDACHVHLFLSLGIQLNLDSSTKGDPANADNKLRLAKIREWMGFPQEQTAI